VDGRASSIASAVLRVDHLLHQLVAPTGFSRLLGRLAQPMSASCGSGQPAPAWGQHLTSAAFQFKARHFGVGWRLWMRLGLEANG